MNSSGTDYLYSIDAGSVAATSLIGAKGRSLQQMAAYGLPVPPGFVLATSSSNLGVTSSSAPRPGTPGVLVIESYGPSYEQPYGLKRLACH